MQAMTTEAPFSAQEVIAVTGELVALSQKELAAYVAQIGHQLVKPESNAFSLLVVACQPSGADIAKAKSIDATILTERQFLDRLPVPDLIERAQGSGDFKKEIDRARSGCAGGCCAESALADIASRRSELL
jgi:hypothetical protein